MNLWAKLAIGFLVVELIAVGGFAYAMHLIFH